MKKHFFPSFLFLSLLMLVFSPLSAQKAKRGKFMLSLNGGSLGGVEFLNGYYGGTEGKPLQLEWDVDTDKPQVEKMSAGSFGISIGYILGTSARHADGNYRFSWYGEFTYCPTVKMSDGIETRRWVVWDQSKFQFVDMSDTFPQTDRKAGMYGATLGVVYMPFSKFPLGLDLGIGMWKFSQEFTSGTRHYFEGKVDTTYAAEESAKIGLAYSGQGKLARNHTALLIKIGLTYKLFKSMSFAVAMRTASFVYNYDTDLVWVESGDPYIGTGTQKLGTWVTAGITFYL
jgi:hypothetical protein